MAGPGVRCHFAIILLFYLLSSTVQIPAEPIIFGIIFRQSLSYERACKCAYRIIIVVTPFLDKSYIYTNSVYKNRTRINILRVSLNFKKSL